MQGLLTAVRRSVSAAALVPAWSGRDENGQIEDALADFGHDRAYRGVASCA